MVVFNLFQSMNKISVNQKSFLKKWTLSNQRTVNVFFKSLGKANQIVDSNPFVGQDRFLLEITEYVDNEKRNFIYIRTGSGLILVDTEGNLNLSHLLLDGLMEQSMIQVYPLQPSIKNIIAFIMEGEILRLNVATRYGIEDISQKAPFDWTRLEQNPLISAALELNYNGPFQIRIGSGSVSLHGEINKERIEYVAQLIEKHLLNGETLLESESAF